MVLLLLRDRHLWIALNVDLRSSMGGNQLMLLLASCMVDYGGRCHMMSYRSDFMMNLRLVIHNMTRWCLRHMHWCTMWCHVMRLRSVLFLHRVGRRSGMVHRLVMHCWSEVAGCLSISVLFC